MIEPRKDAYGPEADTSNLADYLELLALADTPLKKAELADYLAEQEWVVRSRELFTAQATDEDEPSQDDQDGGAGEAPADKHAGYVFALLEERAETLGDLYPFAVGEVSLTLRDPLTVEHQAYLALLAVTVAHHHDVQTDELPERVFESIVADVMRSRGLPTVDTGKAGRETNDFRGLVQAVGDQLELAALPNAVISRTHANEEGVDTVSHLGWGDTRAGHWVFIGQATCAKSNEWLKKIKEPDSGLWGPLLGCILPLVGYLAVPHHVEDEHLTHLSTRARRMVMDRLRLARFLDYLSEDQTAVVTAVRAEPVFHPLRG